VSSAGVVVASALVAVVLALAAVMVMADAVSLILSVIAWLHRTWLPLAFLTATVVARAFW